MRDKHIHLDIVGGIAGDMFISAMVDSHNWLEAVVLDSVAKVIPADVGLAQFDKGLNKGISGLKFKLVFTNSQHAHNHAHDHSYEHSYEQNHEHKHDHHNHSHNHDNSHDNRHNHEDSHQHDPRTTYAGICHMLAHSNLPAEIIEIAKSLLTIIGKAEAKIHHKTLADVHFHELADWDSVMDVVAIASILHKLQTCTWSISDLPIGGGLVKTAHGLLPVPAPATAEILQGFTFFDDGVKGERITPTGAAILAYLRENNLLTAQPSAEFVATGYGLGTKQLPNMPNILRALIFNKPTAQIEQESAVVIEFDIDDMTGEELAFSSDKIRQQAGVLDLLCYSGRGKKNRPIESFRIIAQANHFDEIVDLCFQQTSTIGLRYYSVQRNCLSREAVQLNGMKAKKVQRSAEVTVKVEHDDLVAIETLHQRRLAKFSREI